MANKVVDYWNYLNSLNERTRSAVRTTKSASMIADMQSMLSEVMSSNSDGADKSLAIGIVLLILLTIFQSLQYIFQVFYVF